MNRRHRFSRFTRLLAVAAVAFASVPQVASAQFDDPEESLVRNADGRLRGYEESGVVLEGGSTALTYFAFAGLAAVAAGVMFKSARRTHLD